MKNKKRMLALMLSALMITGMAGCGAKGEASEKEGNEKEAASEELTIWCWDENYNIPIMETAAKYYQEAGHPDFKVNIVNVPENDIETKSKTAFTSGVSEGMPDILLMGDYSAQSFLADYPDQYADLSDVVKAEDFAPNKVACYTVDDKLYGVPFDSGSAGMYYRIDLFSEAGYTEEDLKDITWKQLVEIAKDVKEKTGKYVFEHKIKESEWKLFPSYKWQVCAQEEVSERLYTTKVSFCDCGRKCKMLAEVQDGCVLSIRPDSGYEKKRFVGCARGHQYRQTFLSPRRLRYPMVRRGKRGDRFMKDLLALTGGYLNYYNYYSCACAEHALPYVYGTDQCGSSEEEMKKTRLLILWGHNPADTIWGDAFLPNLAKAKKEGVRIVVIDPRKSDTAMQFADQWIGIRPSTDGAMADAMAYEIWNRGLQDQAFMDRYCVGFDREHMPEGVPSELNYHDYLFGLQDGVKKTAEWAEAITGVPAVTIRELAIEYAVTKPACLMPGLGPQRTLNGEQNCRSFAMLACLTGNTGISGGYPNKKGYGAPSYTLRENPYAGQIPSFLWPKAAEDWTDFSAEDGLKGVRKLDSGIKMIFNLASGMMINQHSDVNRTIRILSDEKKIEMLVVSELFMTPGAKYADILLPGTSFFETENIVPPWNASDYILYNKNTIKPLFDGRFEYEWIREVAEKMGVEEELTKGRTTSEWLKILYEVFREEEKELPEYEAFIKEGCYVPCEEGAEDPKRKEYPLLLFGYHTKWRCHSIHDQNTYLNQVDPPVLWMHPEDAAQRKITDGEIAEIYNERGRMQIGIKVTERIVKGAVALSEGGWFTPDQDGVDKRGCINVLTMSHRSTPLAKANPQHTNLVEVKQAVTVKNVTI